VRIVEARLPAADPEALTAWYSERVGAAPTFVPGEPTPHHFAFHVAGFERWRGRLDLSEEHDFSSWGDARSVYFRDPEGNVGELVARPHAGPEPSLAEIGLPVDDVPAAVDALATLGLTPYREPDETFAPVGDEDGLLIVVRVGRGWFPVGEPAGAAPIDVVVEGAGRGELEVPGSAHRVLAVR
jgi:hypothetical protein